MARLKSNRSIVAIALGALLFVLSACGGGTPVEISPTPIPTAESEPTVVDDDEYLDAAQAVLTGLIDLANDAADVLDRADANSEAWRAEAREALEGLRAHHRDAESLTPPSHLVETHETLLAATERLARAAELLADGIDNFDPDILEAAAAEILQGFVAIEEAHTALLNAAIVSG